jgi:HPr kinase/phosphorylase
VSATLLHATAIAIAGNGVLLLGPSGSGKSDLALRLIDRGAMLISDDAVPVKTGGPLPLLTAAANIEGKLEVRGVGICSVAFVPSAPLRLVVQLSDEIDRMPPDNLTMTIGGFAVPVVHLVPFEISAAIKLEYALRSVVDAGLWPVALEHADAPESPPH